MKIINNRKPLILTAATIFAAAALATAAGGVDPIKIRLLKAAPELDFHMPAPGDTAVAPENQFKATGLLDNISPADPFASQRQDWTTLLPDTAGVFHLAGAKVSDGEARVSRLATSLRPDGIFVGTLKVSTPMAARLYVNGAKAGERLTSDSVAGDITAPLSLSAGEDARVELHLLSTPDDKATPTVAMTLTPDEASKGIEVKVAPDKSLFNLETTTLGPRVASVSISPDGKYMIVATSVNVDGKTPLYSYDLRECASGRVLETNFGEGLAWLPGSKSTLYGTRDLGRDRAQLFAIDYPSLKKRVLAPQIPAKAASMAISPAGDYGVMTHMVEGPKVSGTLRRTLSPDDRIPGNRDRSYLSIVRFADGIERPLTRGGSSNFLYDISYDGKKILYASARETPDKYPFYDFALVEIDPVTFKTDTLVNHEGSISSACYSPDAGQVFITASPNAFDGAGSNCGDHPLANDFDIQGYILDIASRKVTPVTRDFDPSLQGTPIWNRADGCIYFRALKGFDCIVCSLDPKDGRIEILPTKIDYIRQFSIGDTDARYLAYTGMSYEYMGRACMLDLKSGKSTLIADPMQPILADIELGKSQMWAFEAPDGTVVEGTITLPPGFTPTKKYPCIVYYYGGTTPSNHTNHSPYTPQLFAAQGYVVYVLNPSGTIGYGQEYSARHVNAWGDRTADEIIYGVEKLCETHPFIDRDKIGCLGASYGGFMTQLLTTKTDLFAAAVSHAGISNVASYWGEGYWGYSYNSVAAAKSYPWSNPEVFTRNSSLFNADKIHTPLLLLHGSVDTNVPIGESIQLFNALRLLGREVEFVTVDGENHIIMDYQKRKEWHAAIMAWFAKWLKDDPRAWDKIFPPKK